VAVLTEIFEENTADVRRAHEVRGAQVSVVQIEVGAEGGADMIR
jgi:hypothetical protein